MGAVLLSRYNQESDGQDFEPNERDWVVYRRGKGSDASDRELDAHDHSPEGHDHELDAQGQRSDGSDHEWDDRDHRELGKHSHNHPHDEKQMSPEDVTKSLLYLGEVALAAGDYESAATAYASVLQLRADVTALYNLGSFYARGLGVPQDYTEGARLFHQAELLGNERAGMLCRKCMLDYINADLGCKSPAETYATMAVFVSKVYPEVADQKAATCSGLVAVALTNQSKGDDSAAEKVFRAAAEFGGDETARRYLADFGNAARA